MIKKGKYRHYKGNDYEVLEIARHSETEEWHVVYRQLYGDKGVWIRLLAMFDETITIDGEQKKRFQYLSDTD